MTSQDTGLVRVLHVVQSLGTGGLENGVVNLANGIDRQRFACDVLCLRYIGELRERLIPECRVYFDQRTASSILAAALAVRRLCREGRYDVIHTHGWATLLPGYLGARAAGRTRVINGEHGTFFVDTRRRRLAQKLLFRLVDANCAVSESLRGEMYELFSHPPERVTSIINGVDVRKYRPNESERHSVRTALGIRDDQVLFGTVGRLVPVKDYRTLVGGFRRLHDKVPGSRLLVVGDGPELDALRDAAGALADRGTVLFAGNRDDVPSLMRAMDVFCLTSLREGLSNTLLEAHASGLPVIATATGGNGEVVERNVTGYLFEVGDEAALAALMQRLAENSDLRQRLGSAARIKAANGFSIEGMVRAYEELYCRVV